MVRIVRRLILGACVAAGFVVMTGGAAAAAQEPGAAELRKLKAAVEDRFQIVTLRRGLVLVPRAASPAYNNIELTDDGLVLIDGTAVTGRELRARVTDGADVVVQLTFLDADTRRALVAKAPARAVPPPASPAGPAEPAVPAPPAVTPPEPPDAPAADDGWVERSRSRRGGARVRVGGDVWVKEDETAGDAVVAVFGDARVDGRVDGDVVAVLGGVTLGPKADIRGNVVAVGGAVERAAGARVDGDLNEVRIGFPSTGPWFRIRPWQNWHWWGSPFGASTDLLASLMRMAIIGLFVALIALAGGAPVRRVSGVVTHEPWRAALAGLFAQIFFVPLLVITVVVLVVSIIGIPLLLLVPFGLLALVFALFLGFAGAASAIGDALARRSGRTAPPVLVSLAAGLAVIWGLTLVARFVGLAGDPLRVVISVVLTAGFLIEYVAWTVGLGAVLLSRFGRRGAPVPPGPPAPVTEFV